MLPSDKRLWWIVLPALLVAAAAAIVLKFKCKKMHDHTGTHTSRLQNVLACIKHETGVAYCLILKWEDFLHWMRCLLSSLQQKPLIMELRSKFELYKLYLKSVRTTKASSLCSFSNFPTAHLSRAEPKPPKMVSCSSEWSHQLGNKMVSCPSVYFLR